MAEHGHALHSARTNLVAALADAFASQQAGPFARAELALAGWETDDLAPILQRSRARDAKAGRTLEGPHRIDLLVSHADKRQPAARCSTGEQKALLLGTVLAHADLVARNIGKRPILLLDEVAAHLDERRRAALFERLGQAGGQVWMTGTDDALFAGAGESATRLRIHNGQVTQ
jgi:DNA replication and repair protein RecF